MIYIDKVFSRRTFLKAAGVLSAALFSGCSLQNNPAVKKAARTIAGSNMPDSDFVRQIITRDSQTSRTVMWQSLSAQKEAVVLLREQGSEKSRSFSAESAPYNDDEQKLFLHTAHLTGLEAGKKYEYQLKYNKETSTWYPLTTDNGGSFKALIFPDSQSNDYSVWEKNFRAAAKANPDAALFINLGDLVDNGEDHSQWAAWFSAVEPVICRIPFAPVMGNHETYDNKWKVRLPHAYLNEFAVPDNGSKSFDRYYYSFDYGDVHFVVLNTQWDEIEEFIPGILDHQLEWLREDVARSSKKWKVALFHKDVLKYAIKTRPERQPGICEAGQYFMPVLEELGFDLVLTAHLHTYRNRGHLKAFEASKTGPVYILTGVVGNVFYNNFWVDHKLDKAKAPQPETGNYLTLYADKNQLQIKSYLINGECFDEIALKK